MALNLLLAASHRSSAALGTFNAASNLVLVRKYKSILSNPSSTSYFLPEKGFGGSSWMPLGNGAAAGAKCTVLGAAAVARMGSEAA